MREHSRQSDVHENDRVEYVRSRIIVDKKVLSRRRGRKVVNLKGFSHQVMNEEGKVNKL